VPKAIEIKDKVKSKLEYLSYELKAREEELVELKKTKAVLEGEEE